MQLGDNLFHIMWEETAGDFVSRNHTTILARRLHMQNIDLQLRPITREALNATR